MERNHNPDAIVFEEWAAPILADDEQPDWLARRLAVAAQHVIDNTRPVTA